MADVSQHLFAAFGKFLQAGFDPALAQRGILGFWLGPPSPSRSISASLSASEILARSRESALLWEAQHPVLANPYQDLVTFLEAGGDLGRWENNILAAYLPGGEWRGIPLSSFLRSSG